MSTKVSANKAFRLYVAKMRRVAFFLISNLHKEVRPHQYESVCNQATSQYLAARRFSAGFEKLASEQPDLTALIGPLQSMIEKWVAFLTEKRATLERYSQLALDELGEQSNAILLELREELEKLAEGLVELRRQSKMLEDASEDDDGTPPPTTAAA